MPRSRSRSSFASRSAITRSSPPCPSAAPSRISSIPIICSKDYDSWLRFAATVRRSRMTSVVRRPSHRASYPRTFALSHSRTSLLRRLHPPVLPQVRVDERIQVPVHHLLHVGDLQLGAMVVHHRVRLEDVGADLAAEGDVGLGRLQLGLLLLLLLQRALVERGL